MSPMWSPVLTPAQEADDYLWLGEVLVKRLDEALEGAWPVELVERPDQILAADKRPLAAMWMWGGDVFATTPAGTLANAQEVTQQWLLVLALNSVQANPRQLRTTRIGNAMRLAHKAVHGWKAPGLARGFQRTNSRMPPIFTPNKATYPLAFQIQLYL